MNMYQILSVFGIQNSGLSISLVAADKPTLYIPRITKTKDMSVSSDKSRFTTSILSYLMLKEGPMIIESSDCSFVNKVVRELRK